MQGLAKLLVVDDNAQDRHNLSTILEFVGENGDLADPFGGNQEVYNKCFTQMKPALDNLFLDLNSEKE